MPIRRPHKRARNHRKTMPEGERRLWVRLRDRQLGGHRFRRQHTIGPYVADFACIEAMLVIECDGEQHGFDDARAHDEKRDAFLTREGWTVLRFWNREIHDNMDGVLATILDAAENSVRYLKTKPASDDIDYPPIPGFAGTSPVNGGRKNASQRSKLHPNCAPSSPACGGSGP